MQILSSLVIGIVGGSLVGLYLSLRATRHLAATPRKRAVYWTGAIGGLLIALPALFLAMAVGGSVGGGTGTEIGARLGEEALGASMGVALGAGALMAACLVLGSTVGSVIGRAISMIGDDA